MNLLKVLFRPKTWRRYKKPKFKIIEQVYFNGTRNYWVYETNKDIRNGKIFSNREDAESYVESKISNSLEKARDIF